MRTGTCTLYQPVNPSVLRTCVKISTAPSSLGRRTPALPFAGAGTAPFSSLPVASGCGTLPCHNIRVNDLRAHY